MVTQAEYDDLLDRVERIEEVLGITHTPALTPSKSKRGTRLPANFMPSDEAVTKIRSEFPWMNGDQMTLEHRKFCDYWLAKAGANAVKLDWDRTWCNWMRTATERMPHTVASTVDRKIDELQAMKEPE